MTLLQKISILPFPTPPFPPPLPPFHIFWISLYLEIKLHPIATATTFFFFFWITPASWQLCKIMAPGCERAESETMKEPFIPCLKLFVQMLPLKMDYPPP